MLAEVFQHLDLDLQSNSYANSLKGYYNVSCKQIAIMAGIDRSYMKLLIALELILRGCHSLNY